MFTDADQILAQLIETESGSFGLSPRHRRQPPALLLEGLDQILHDARCDLVKIIPTVSAVPRVEVALEGTQFRNRYDIWVYAPKPNTNPPEGTRISRKLDAAALEYLKGGGKVLLLPELSSLKRSIKGSFQTDFWCFPMFRRAAERNKIEVAPGTLGILCDPRSPALAEFPTEFHSNWQWWHLVKNSRPIILDDTPADYRPLLQVIDNFERNHKLGLIFEARVGKGRLLVCAIDLLHLHVQHQRSHVGNDSDAHAERHGISHLEGLRRRTLIVRVHDPEAAQRRRQFHLL